jgi:hypothetical protein
LREIVGDISTLAAPNRGVSRSAHGSGATQGSEVDATSTLQTLQAEIAARMRRGDSFDSVETDVIDRCGLPAAEKAALWLYGWSFVPWQRQRREAIAQIDVLVDSQDSAASAVRHLQLAGRGARRPRRSRARR